MFENFLNEIKAFDRIIIHRHTTPDGDALGSQIGLKHILKQTDKG
jgi:phosphoesterase RecJ-like protein